MSRLDEIRAMVAEPGFDPVDLVVADIAYLLRFTDPDRLARALASEGFLVGVPGEDRWELTLQGAQSVLAALEAQDD